MKTMFKPCAEYPQYLVCSDGYLINTGTGKVLHGSKNGQGYRQTTVVALDGSQHTVLVHRIVAQAFCSRAEGQTEVNHIDGDKMNSRADNLEWVTHGDNLAHAFETGLMPNNTTPRAVIATAINTGEKMFFPSIYKAARFLSISQGNICMACNGLRPFAGGYYWRYDE